MISSLLLALALAQSSPSNLTINADYSWSRRWRPGEWTPVKIELANTGPTFEGVLVLRWGANSFQPRDVTPESLDDPDPALYRIPVALPEKSRRLITAYVRAPAVDRVSLWVFLVRKTETVKRFEILGAPLTAPLVVGVVGERVPGGIKDSFLYPVEIVQIRPPDLPDRWYGYALIDTLIWTDGDPTALRHDAQAEALRQWVSAGGRLLVARGEIAGIGGSFLAPLIPAALKADHVRESLPRLNAFLRQGGGPGPFRTTVLEARPRGGTVLLDDPPIIRGRWGMGEVTLIGLDPSREPFSSWRAMTELWRRTMTAEPRSKPDPNRYYDSTTQALGSAELSLLSQVFPGFQPPSLSWIFLLLLVYAGLVGPVDYLVLRRLRRFEWTWLTFPAVVVAFSALTLGLGTSAGRLPSSSREMTVIDTGPDGMQRGFAVTSCISPEGGRVTFAARPVHSVLGVLAGASFDRQGDERSGTFEVALEPAARVMDWRMPRGATAIAATEWLSPNAPGLTFRIEGDRLRVSNGYSSPVRGVLYVTPRGFHSLKDLPAGESDHSLGNPTYDYRTGVQMHFPSDEARLSQYANHYNPHVDVTRLAIEIERVLVSLSFRKSIPNAQAWGRAEALDATDWLGFGGTLLMGFLSDWRTLDLEGLPAAHSAVVLVRAFGSHD